MQQRKKKTTHLNKMDGESDRQTDRVTEKERDISTERVIEWQRVTVTGRESE